MEKLRKPLLLSLAAACLLGVGVVQRGLNQDRDTLGLTRVQPLENAPPVLAFTTVALGGFRGLISNALWMRANDLQEEGRYFEMAQLADWITKLEPGFAQVWTVQAWNMAYNISVKFKDNPPGDFSDRWRWVQRGIELLRDEGLRYNPNEPLLYAELAWFFHHKLGDNLDDGNMFYKERWAGEMAAVLGNTNRPGFDRLIDPQTDEDRARAATLRDRYKLDPVLMQEVDREYGPLEWRLPESHAIYWAARGMKQAAVDPERFNRQEMDRLRRSIYQGMMRAFQRGRLISFGPGRLFQFGPNLDIVPKVSATYEQLMNEEDVKIRDSIATAHSNFLGDAVYFLYTYNRVREAQQWYDYLAKLYPNKSLLGREAPSLPRDLTLDEYCFERVQEDLGETSQVRVTALIEGLVANSYMSLVFDNDDRAAGLMALAAASVARYTEASGSDRRIEIASLEEIQSRVLKQLLDPQTGLVPEARARLRFKLNLDPERAPAPAPGTNTPPATAAPSAAS
ncbi:MAG: hypothetical protein MUE94_00195 [Verrucomicrobia bacterium]|jgi:hypothetical protein|nr:hypothetical protein [Verrucomicrobiota bacterium]